MKKQKYTLDVMEQELGKTIDSINKEPNDLNDSNISKDFKDPNDLISNNPMHLAPPISLAEQELKEKEKLIMKNIWVPESVDCQIKLIRAMRQRQRMPNKFNDIANEALVEYIQRHLDEELQSSSD